VQEHVHGCVSIYNNMYVTPVQSSTRLEGARPPVSACVYCKLANLHCWTCCHHHTHHASTCTEHCTVCSAVETCDAHTAPGILPAALQPSHISRLARMPLVQAVAAADHLCCSRIPRYFRAPANLISKVLSTISSGYLPCTLAALRSRLRSLDPHGPETAVQEDRRTSGMPAAGEMCGSALGVPRVLLCWEGPDEVVSELARVLRSGALRSSNSEEAPITAMHLATLSGLDVQTALLAVGNYRVALRGDRLGAGGGGSPVALFMSAVKVAKRGDHWWSSRDREQAKQQRKQQGGRATGKCKGAGRSSRGGAAATAAEQGPGSRPGSGRRAEPGSAAAAAQRGRQAGGFSQQYDDGWEEQYDDGWDEQHDDGWEEQHDDGWDEQHDDAWDEQHDDGWEEQYDCDGEAWRGGRRGRQHGGDGGEQYSWQDSDLEEGQYSDGGYQQQFTGQQEGQYSRGQYSRGQYSRGQYRDGDHGPGRQLRPQSRPQPAPAHSDPYIPTAYPANSPDYDPTSPYPADRPSYSPGDGGYSPLNQRGYDHNQGQDPYCSPFSPPHGRQYSPARTRCSPAAWSPTRQAGPGYGSPVYSPTGGHGHRGRDRSRGRSRSRSSSPQKRDQDGWQGHGGGRQRGWGRERGRRGNGGGGPRGAGAAHDGQYDEGYDGGSRQQWQGRGGGAPGRRRR
jgi:hypothetical protein